MLNLSNTQVTDVGVKELKVLDNLVELSVENKGRKYETMSQFLFAIHQFGEDTRSAERAVDTAYSSFLDATRGSRIAHGYFENVGTAKRELQSIGYDDVLPIDVVNICIRNIAMVDDRSTRVGQVHGVFGKDASAIIPAITSLYKTQLSDAGLKDILQIKNLSVLIIRATAISDAGIQDIVACKRLTCLDISNTNVKDEGIVKLKGLTNLRMLNLSYTSVTDIVFIDLKQLTNLNVLDLRGTGLTSETETMLRKAMPKCRIIKSP